MESAVRIGPLSSLQKDITSNNSSDHVSSEYDGDKVLKDCVNQNESSNDSRENHSDDALLGPQSLQEFMRAEQNGCVAAELSFGEGIYLFCLVLKSVCGPLVTTAWRVVRLQMETASRYRG
jgi:hypothetical protein